MRRIFHFFIFFLSLNISAQDVLMQAWYWDYPKTANGASFVDTLNEKVPNLANAGITDIWLPPLSRASFGSNSNGYDPKDLYDLGEYGLGPTGFGTRTKLDQLIANMNLHGLKPIADVVYNHRDGGKAEANTAVEGWIENFNCTKATNGDQPYPSDRVRMLLPLGGSSANGTGTYYFKIRSASKHPNFYDKPYVFYAQTNKVGYQGLAALSENEGNNGGGDCGQASDIVQLGVDMLATIDNVGSCGGGCGLDEFALTISASDYNLAGDSLWIYLTNQNGQYSDHYISFIWSGARGANVQQEVVYQTYSDFSNLPSGQGTMNYTNFKPNGNPTNLGGDWDAPLFFYDYDQNVPSTRQRLIDWTQWLWEDVGIRGIRMDAVKHFDPAFVGALLDSLHLVGQNQSLVVGEFFDTNASSLKSWVNDVESNMSISAKSAMDVGVFDFALRSALKSACDQFGYDARNIFTSGIVDGAGGMTSNAVTFINNHDYRDIGQPVYNDPILAYAYILTNRKVGMPTVFYPDYYGIHLPHGPSDSLKIDIDRLIDIHNKYIHGGTTNYLNNNGTPGAITYNSGYAETTLIYQSYSGGHLNDKDAIMAINFAGDTLDVEFPISANSSKLSGTIFRDFTGKSLTFEVILDVNNKLRVVLPPRSYGVWVDETEDDNCVVGNKVFVDRNATGLNNGTSWKNAFVNLASAIHFSNICPQIDEIWVKEGIHLPNVISDRAQSFVTKNKLRIIGGFPSSISAPTMSDRDPELTPTILSGNIGSSMESDNSFHVLKNLSTDTLFLVGVTIENGLGNGSNLEERVGGGVSNNGVLMLEEVIIRNCQSDEKGSAIHAMVGSHIEMKDCEISGNSGPNEIHIEEGAVLKINGEVIVNHR